MSITSSGPVPCGDCFNGTTGFWHNYCGSCGGSGYENGATLQDAWDAEENQGAAMSMTDALALARRSLR